MEKPTKQQLKDMMWFQVLSVEDLPEAYRQETFKSWSMRNNIKPSIESKLDFIIYKQELN